MTGDELKDAIAALKWENADALARLRIDAVTFSAWTQGEREIPRWAVAQLEWELRWAVAQLEWKPQQSKGRDENEPV
jgi:hypothetical protein